MMLTQICAFISHEMNYLGYNQVGLIRFVGLI